MGDGTACAPSAGIRGRRGCRSASSRGRRARASPARPAGRRRLPADASRSCGEACAASRAFVIPAFSAARLTMPHAPTRESGSPAGIEQHRLVLPRRARAGAGAGTPTRAPITLRPIGTRRSFPPLPNTRTSSLRRSKSVSPSPHSSETRIPAPYPAPAAPDRARRGARACRAPPAAVSPRSPRAFPGGFATLRGSRADRWGRR